MVEVSPVQLRAMATATKSSDDAPDKRLQQLGKTLQALTPEQREQAIKVAANLLAAKAKAEQQQKG